MSRASTVAFGDLTPKAEQTMLNNKEYPHREDFEQKADWMLDTDISVNYDKIADLARGTVAPVCARACTPVRGRATFAGGSRRIRRLPRRSMLARALPLVLLVAGCGRSLDAGDAGLGVDMALAVDSDFALGATGAGDLGVTCGDLGTDPQCGSCGRECLVIATGQSMPAALVVDSQNVYWRNLGILADPEPPYPGPYSHGQLMSSPVGSASPTVLGSELTDAPEAFDPAALALAGGLLYFSQAPPFAAQNLVTCAISGCAGAPTVLLTGAELATLAVDAGSVYWTDFSASAVLSVPLSGGSVTTLWTPPVVGAPGVGVASGLAIDGNDLYWANGSSILTCPKSGCGAAPTTVAAQALSFKSVVVVDANNVYWTDSNPFRTGKIYECPKSGCGTTPTVLADGIDGARGLAVDADDVYWVEYYGGTIFRCAISGCANQPTLLAAQLSFPIAIAVDDHNVYWTEAGDGGSGAGAVKRMAK
jgi:hypothetical protein